MSTKKSASRRRLGRGTLTLIAIFLVSSALLRLGNDAGSAFARESEAGSNEVTTTTLPEAPTQSQPTTEELQKMLEAFQTRESRLVDRERALEERLQALAVAEAQIDRKMAALVDAENRLRETLTYSETAAEEDLARLTAVYENMKPKQAAALFEEMAPEFAAGFLGRMRADLAAGIMAGLTPETANAVSVLLAGRNASLPE